MRSARVENRGLEWVGGWESKCRPAEAQQHLQTSFRNRIGSCGVSRWKRHRALRTRAQIWNNTLYNKVTYIIKQTIYCIYIVVHGKESSSIWFCFWSSILRKNSELGSKRPWRKRSRLSDCKWNSITPNTSISYSVSCFCLTHQAAKQVIVHVITK